MSDTPVRAPYHILVDGDVVVDHHIYRGCCEHPGSSNDGTQILRDHGGASLTARLLTGLCKGERLLKCIDATPPVPRKLRPDPAVHHAYATWTTFPLKKEGVQKKEPKVWRVTETMGFGVVEDAKVSATRKKSASDVKDCAVVVIDEGGLGFRNRPRDWPAVLCEQTEGEPPWIVLKMSHPVCIGDLWTRIRQAPYADRLIVIVAADDLRRSGASISQGLSWEQSVVELLGDLAFHADICRISAARHVIVNFGHDGALWIDNSVRSAPIRRLVFDPGHLEGTWQEDLDGTVLGAGACLPASVARALFEVVPMEGAEMNDDGKIPTEFKLTNGADLGSGIARGLAARRALLLSGHGTENAKKPGFPEKAVLGVLQGPRGGDLSTVTVPDFADPASTGETGEWSIISGNSIARSCPLYGRARAVAVDGEAALRDIPYGRFGDLYTVDRIELNSFYGIRKLIRDFIDDNDAKKPLSLGVFGPPGSGKSFGITEIVRGILENKTKILTFNLSQFDSPDMIIGALHQVRDEVLRGHVPVVFWDEFDSRANHWLQFMLAPMNDGNFLEGQVTHPIGKCIFIFAGGTCDSFQEFSSHESEEEKKKFKADKGPDFVSRLKGYLNVLGPNRREIDQEVNGRIERVSDKNDLGFPIRRAIMIRVHAKRYRAKKMTIDPGLLNAMLKIGKYEHGARSIATIVNLTTGGGRRGLLRCNLPPREQLGLHVDHDAFMELVQEGAEFKLKAEELAPFVHKFYKEGGWTSQDYENLPAFEKEDNIAAACRLPDILSLVGLLVVDREHGPAADAQMVTDVIKENLELLAEAEHKGWMEFKENNDWSSAKSKDKAEKQHDLLVAYDDLPEYEKDKDRNAVRHYPEIVEEAGFVIRLEGCDDSP